MNAWYLEAEAGDPHPDTALAQVGLVHFELMEQTYEFPNNSPDEVRARFIEEGWTGQ